MPHGSITQTIPAPSPAVFHLLHDYSPRLHWDTLLKDARLTDNFTHAQLPLHPSPAKNQVFDFDQKEPLVPSSRNGHRVPTYNQARSSPATLVIIGSLVLAAIGVSSMWFRRSPSTSPPAPATMAAFDMPIDDAFAVKTDASVVVVGVIAAGEIKPGMRLELQTAHGPIPVTVTAIEGGPGKTLASARAGDRVGVLLQGVNTAQISTGSRLTGVGG